MIDKERVKKDSPVKKNKDNKNDILEIILEIDKIHKENQGKVTAYEYKLRLRLCLRINIWSIAIKFKKFKRIIFDKASDFLHWIIGPPDP